MTKRVCGANKYGGLLVVLFGLLLGMGCNTFAAHAVDLEWVVIQGSACVDADRDSVCSPDELGVPNLVVRSDGTALATTDAAGRFSVRVLAQSVIEFELPVGYTSASGELSTQVFESGLLTVPLIRQIVATVTVWVPTATAIMPTATTRAKAIATLTPALEPSPTKFLPTKTPAPKVSPTLTSEAITAPQALATATVSPATTLPQPTETATTSVAIVLSGKLTSPPVASATPINSLPSFEEEAQPAPQFSLGSIPRAYFVSGGVLLVLGLLIGLFAYRSSALKTNGLASASVTGGYPAGAQTMVWEQGASQQSPQSSQPPLPASGMEWQPIAQRLLSHAHLKSISIDAEAGILAASTVPAPIFVLGGSNGNRDGYRLVFTIDPSLPVRSGLIADRSQISRTAKLAGASRGDAHSLWKYAAQARNLENPTYPTWADWYLIVYQQVNQTTH